MPTEGPERRLHEPVRAGAEQAVLQEDCRSRLVLRAGSSPCDPVNSQDVAVRCGHLVLLARVAMFQNQLQLQHNTTELLISHLTYNTTATETSISD